MITKLLCNLSLTSRYCWETSADDYQASVESCQDFDILLGKFCRWLRSLCGILSGLRVFFGKVLQMITKLLWNVPKTWRYFWESSEEDCQVSLKSYLASSYD